MFDKWIDKSKQILEGDRRRCSASKAEYTLLSLIDPQHPLRDIMIKSNAMPKLHSGNTACIHLLVGHKLWLKKLDNVRIVCYGFNNSSDENVSQNYITSKISIRGTLHITEPIVDKVINGRNDWNAIVQSEDETIALYKIKQERRI